MGLPVGEVRRAVIWTFTVDPGAAAALAATLATLEPVFNPNKHRMVERAESQPRRGEVWIAARDETPLRSIAGRTLAGVSLIEQRTAWELLDEQGSLVAPRVLDRAVETFLCNPAFQKAIR